MKTTLVAMCAAMLCACSSGQESDSSGTTPVGPGGVTNPTSPGTSPATGYVKFGALTAPEQALVGTDKNVNGVRDDVESWIASTYKDPAAQAATIKYSQWLTWTMVRGARGAKTSRAELDTFGDVGSCWFKTTRAAAGPDAPSIKTLEAKIFNSYARAKAYLAWNASTSGMPSTTSLTPCDVTAEVTKP